MLLLLYALLALHSGSRIHLQSPPVNDEFSKYSKRYLRDFFSVMLQSATSPLHIDKVGLTLSKHTVCEFSPFFKKGVFDYSSHGTG
ncbi:hypothetical protein CB1_000637018 [Camelus ferus]|nr:hypothetical protein CB1_000637018 [Camelus ferus]